MARRIRFALSLLLVSFAMVASACAEASTGPTMNAETTCEQNNPNTCH